MKIELGGLELFYSGTLISIPNESVKFFIEDLVFEFKFINDKENPNDIKVTAESTNNGKSLVFIFKNFNNSLGTGNSQLLPVGTLKGRQLFLNYRIYALNDGVTTGESGKTIHYTWYLK